MVDDDFGNWLAGFVDGEGCFGIYKRSDSSGWIFRFFVKLRDDDSAILYECQRRFGGTVRKEPSKNPKWGGQAIWAVSKRSDCLRLVELFDTHPLRAKKRLDFAVWRQAVILFEGVTRHEGNAKTAKANEPIWAKIQELKSELTDLRRYTHD